MVVLSAPCFHHPHRVSRLTAWSARHGAEQQPARASSNQLRRRGYDAGVVQFTPSVRESPDDHDDGNVELVEQSVGNGQHAGIPGAGSRRNEGSADHIDPKLVWAGGWGQGTPSARLGGMGASQDEVTGTGHHPAGMTQSLQCAVHPLRVMAGEPPVADITPSSPTLRRVERRPVMSVLASTDSPLLNVMWTMVVFFMWILWIWLLITVFSDLFRRRDVSTGGKVLWTVALLVLPFLGVFIYLISQGHAMQDRAMEDQKASKAQFDDYVRSVSSNGNGHSASEIGQAKQLLDSGAINADEFEALKAKALAS